MSKTEIKRKGLILEKLHWLKGYASAPEFTPELIGREEERAYVARINKEIITIIEEVKNDK